METLKLYRGICLKESDVNIFINSVKNNGLEISKNQSWHFQKPNNKIKLKNLFDNENLTKNDVYPSVWIEELNNGKKITYNSIDDVPRSKHNSKGGYRQLINSEDYLCFADKLGATYYALQHNKTKEKNISLLIEVEVPISDVIIDGRDFLFTAFNLGILKSNNQILECQIEILKFIFGNSIEIYIDKLIETKNIAIIDLIEYDDNIIKDYFNNNVLLNGRYNTIFRYSFMVKAPIKSNMINDITIINESYYDNNSAYSLDDFLHGSYPVEMSEFIINKTYDSNYFNQIISFANNSKTLDLNVFIKQVIVKYPQIENDDRFKLFLQFKELGW